MFEEFSDAYYLGRLYVEPHEGGRPAIQEDDFDEVRRGLYDGDDMPLVMKVGRRYLVVGGDESVPRGTLSVPRDAVDRLDVRNPPVLKEVLLAKSGHAARMLGLIGDG